MNEIEEYNTTAILKVYSHALHKDLVVLNIDGNEITVEARLLRSAIDNATNV